jgi:predicted MFS family arabinose efflux permease
MSPPATHSPRRVVLALGTAQTVAWASSFYLPTLLAEPMARDLGITPPTVFAALSAALVIGALVSPWAGRRIDRGDGRSMLLGAWALFVAGLGALALAQDLWTLVLAWALLGLAMGCGLYDAAFATLVRLHGPAARRSISGITLIAGFASTVGWPLTAWMEARWGWRGACVGWMALHTLVALPLILSLPRARRQASAAAVPYGAPAGPSATVDTATANTPAPDTRRLVLVALLFVCLGFVSTSVATHLPALVMAMGVPLAGAVAVAALAGPAQVAARLLELQVLSRFSPLLAARLAALGHPTAALAAVTLGPAGALPFVVLHGLGNGLLTIVRGTLPLALFGAAGYGARQGWIALPGRLVGAASPFVLGWVLEHHGLAALGLTAGLSAVALLLLMLLRLPAPRP